MQLSLTDRLISHYMREPRRSFDYMVLSVSVCPNGNYRNLFFENDDQSRLDDLMHMQQRLERNKI